MPVKAFLPHLCYLLNICPNGMARFLNLCRAISHALCVDILGFRYNGFHMLQSYYCDCVVLYSVMLLSQAGIIADILRLRLSCCITEAHFSNIKLGVRYVGSFVI